MSETRIIRYTTKPELAEENARLIRDVFAELDSLRPAGIQYTASRLDDGVSFVHVVTLDGPDNPLPRMAAFAEFQRNIGERCVEGPVTASAATVGSYPLG